MDIGISVLAVLAVLAGGALGTFRHRSYGIWSFAGILLAMTIANVAGSLFGTYLTTAVNGDIVTVTVLVQITLVVVISLLISYYCDNLIPVKPDPKTRTDNIYAGSFGVVNAYLVVASILGYLKAIPNADPKIADNMFANSFNNWLFDALPWVMMATFFYVIGWASVRKIREAVDMLKASMQKPTAQPTSSTTASLPTSVSYSSSPSPSYQSPSASFSSSYTPSSSLNPALPAAAAAAVAAVPDEPKQGFFGRLFGGFGRKEEEPATPPPPSSLLNIANCKRVEAAPANAPVKLAITPPIFPALGSVCKIPLRVISPSLTGPRASAILLYASLSAAVVRREAS
jgi:hypothetical protein